MIIYRKNRQIELAKSILESKGYKVERLSEATEGGWSYWEMPKDYKGPFEQDHYYREYENGLIGFIYPPFETQKEWLKDETHSDYVALMWDSNKGESVGEKRFAKMKDAREWLNSLVS